MAQLLTDPHLQQLSNCSPETLGLVLLGLIAVLGVRQNHQRPLQVFLAGLRNRSHTKHAAQIYAGMAEILDVNAMLAHKPISLLYCVPPIVIGLHST